MEMLAIIESPAGGEERAATQLLQELKQQVATINIQRISPLQKTGIFSYLFWLTRSIFNVFILGCNVSSNTVIYTTTYTGILGVLPFKMFKKLFIVFHYHGDRVPPQPEQSWSLKDRFTQRVKRWCVSQLHYFSWSCVDLFCVPSEVTLHHLKATSYTPSQVLDKKSLVIPNGIDVKKFHPITVEKKQLLQEKLSIPKKHFVIGIISRVDPQKSTLETIAYIKKHMSKNRRNVFIVLAAPVHGNDQIYFQKVKIALQQSKIAHHILIGYSEIENIYQSCDIVISHSKQEVFPLSMLESFACGLPYFAIKNGVTEHYLNEVDSTLVLSSKLIPTGATALLQQKLLLYVSKYSWKKSAKMFFNHLNSALAAGLR
jgi:glycosyltransferase involved in cell wall biosynthesis